MKYDGVEQLTGVCHGRQLLEYWAGSPHPEAQTSELVVPGVRGAWPYLGGAAPAFYSHGGYLLVGQRPRGQALDQGH